MGKPRATEPLERLGKGEEPQRLGGRRAVDDERVVAVGMGADLEQGKDVVDPWHGRDLVGDERVHAGTPEQSGDRGADRRPGGVEAGPGVHLQDVEATG